MRRLLTIAAFFLLTGCATVQIPKYISGEHPYIQKMYGDYEKIVSAVKSVLIVNGWSIDNEMHPSVYERATDESKETYKDLLIFTNVKQHTMVLYSSYTHLNVFLHPLADGAEVEIRFGKVTPLMVKKFTSTRNDKLAKKLFRQIEQEVLEAN